MVGVPLFPHRHLDQRHRLGHPATINFNVGIDRIKRGEIVGCIWGKLEFRRVAGFDSECTRTDRYLQGGGKEQKPQSQPTRYSYLGSIQGSIFFLAAVEDVALLDNYWLYWTVVYM